MVKLCSKCLVEKEITLFHRRSKSPDGYQTYCKDCNKSHKRNWLVYNRDKVAINRLWSQYRLRLVDFEKLLKDQNNCCALCLEEFTKTPSVDHDHSCCPGNRSCGSCIRGLLCSGCNTSLGFYELIKSLSTTEDYLNKDRKSPLIRND